MTRLLTLPREGLLNLFPTLAVELKFSPDILDKVKGWLDEINPPLALEAEDKFLANRNALHDALEDLNQVDQEVRRRLLGYSKWFDPANKIEIYARIAAAGYDADIVENNAQRLAESHLITITDIYLLPQDNEVCQIAAESLITEFLRDLEVG